MQVSANPDYDRMINYYRLIKQPRPASTYRGNRRRDAKMAQVERQSVRKREKRALRQSLALLDGPPGLR